MAAALHTEIVGFMHLSRLLGTTLLVFCAQFGVWCERPAFRVHIVPGPGVLDTPVPVEIALPPGLNAENLGGMVLVSPSQPNSSPIPIQAIHDRLVSFIPDTSGEKEYTLTPLRQRPKACFRFEDRGDVTLELFEEETLVLGYNYGNILPPGVPEDRRRSSYVHPIVGLDGEVLSDDFPADHPHHRGLFWAWPRVGVGDQTLDLWHLRGIRHRFESWVAREVGPVCAVVGVRNGWYLDDGTKVVNEKLMLTVFRAGKIGRVVDVDLHLEATNNPITIAGQGDRGYGGFNFRPAGRREEVITTMAGVQQDSDLVPSPWGDFSGRFGDGERLSGLAIFQHSENPRFPSGWCLRHYGFLGVDFPGTEPFELRPGEPLRLRYRVWVHRGDAEDGKVREMYEAFLHPPCAELVVGEAGR